MIKKHIIPYVPYKPNAIVTPHNWVLSVQYYEVKIKYIIKRY